MQYETPSVHLPFVHVFEQQEAPVVHELPDVLQLGLSAAQVPETQLPLQHCASAVHFCVSEMHAAAVHFLFSQRRLQQSVPVAQLSLVAPQVVTTEAQVLLFGSHTPEQQSAPALHCSL